ncbi:hypothetical protein ACH61_02177 [Rathayibacter tanaceti]|uniref:Uncharacterized protein n=1 Tax=Rathayibacter tanaceti TaxID=1671680 RepID=A0A162GPB5_9MICO|nr:hypothetical protein ACH61_02177 [Rathayibacter tanaceti]
MLGLRTDGGGLALGRGTRLGGLGGDGAADGGGLAHGVLGHHVAVVGGLPERRGRLRLRLVAGAVCAATRLRDEALRLVARLLENAVALVAGGATQRRGVVLGLGDDPLRLLLRHAQCVLEFRAQPCVGGCADLLQLLLEALDARGEALHLSAALGRLGVRLDELAAHALDGLVDLVPVVATEHLGEFGLVVRHVVSFRAGPRRGSRHSESVFSARASAGATPAPRAARRHSRPFPGIGGRASAIVDCLCLLPSRPGPAASPSRSRPSPRSGNAGGVLSCGSSSPSSPPSSPPR